MAALTADNEVFTRIVVREHERAMLAYATELTGDRAAAEDAVQEALLRAWRRMDVLVSRPGSMRGWLLKVVRNIVYDTHRARRRRPSEVGELPGIEPVERDHADRVVAAMVVDDALRCLSIEHRQVLEQVYLLGGSVRHAADALGIPPGTVKSRSFYALRALRAVSGTA